MYTLATSDGWTTWFICRSGIEVCRGEEKEYGEAIVAALNAMETEEPSARLRQWDGVMTGA